MPIADKQDSVWERHKPILPKRRAERFFGRFGAIAVLTLLAAAGGGCLAAFLPYIVLYLYSSLFDSDSFMRFVMNDTTAAMKWRFVTGTTATGLAALAFMLKNLPERKGRQKRKHDE